MSKVFFIANTHFGDDDIRKSRLNYGKVFENTNEMDKHLIERWNKVVSEEDTIYVLGNFGAENNEAEILKQLNGKKMLLKGEKEIKSNEYYIDAGFSEVYDKPILFEDLWLYPQAVYLDKNIADSKSQAYKLDKDSGEVNFCTVPVKGASYDPYELKNIRLELKDTITVNFEFWIRESDKTVFLDCAELSSEYPLLHKSIARLEEKDFVSAVITQNCNELYQEVGCKNVIELHKNMNEAIQLISTADMLIVGGASLKKEPIGTIIKHFKGKYIVAIRNSADVYNEKVHLPIKYEVGKFMNEECQDNVLKGKRYYRLVRNTVEYIYKTDSGFSYILFNGEWKLDMGFDDYYYDASSTVIETSREYVSSIIEKMRRENINSFNDANK